MAKQKYAYDSDKVRIRAGDWIMFSYGIPPIRVIGEVFERGGKLLVKTPGHSPSECSLRELRKCVYDFYKWTKPNNQTTNHNGQTKETSEKTHQSNERGI